MKLEKKLVSLRRAKGLTQMKLAEKMNVSRQAISRWESGIAVPSTDNLRFLGQLYGVSIDYLINEESEDFVQSEEDASEENRKSRDSINKRSENTGYQLNHYRKTKAWLLMIIIVIVLIALGLLTHSIAASLAIAITTGNIIMIYLLVRWVVYFVLRVKTNNGGDKEK